MNNEETLGWTQYGRAWFRHGSVGVSLGSSTVVRVVDTGKDDPDFKARPVGFTAKVEPADPLLWDGDGA